MDCINILTLRFEHLGQREEVEVKYRRSMEFRARLYGVFGGHVGFNGQFFDEEEDEADKKQSEVFKKSKLFKNLECTLRSCFHEKKGEIKEYY